MIGQYADVPQDETMPVRIWNVNVAQMLGREICRFKEKLEKEVEAMER